MNDIQKSPAITDEELTGWVATEVMGWRLYNYEEGRRAGENGDYKKDLVDAMCNDNWTWEGRGSSEEAWQWEPITNYNHLYQVLEKIGENECLLRNVIVEVCDIHAGETNWMSVAAWLVSSPRTILLAIREAYLSLNPTE